MTFYNQVRNYYPTYLTAHQDKINRLLHFVGQCATIGWLVGCLSFNLYWFLLLTPFVVYLFAWPGHLLFEKNKPATLEINPLLTKACDWVMFFNILRGRVKIV